MEAFVSSVVREFEEFREAACRGAGLVVDQVLRFEDFPPLTDPSRKACLDGVLQADVVVLVLGARYGTPQPSSGLSPTHEEYREAGRLGRPVLALVQSGVNREPEQDAFVQEVQGSGDWGEGVLTGRFSTPEQLRDEVIRGLSRYQATGRQAPPRLEIVYGDGPEHMHEATMREVPPRYRKVYRIGIRVAGESTVGDVRVLLASCDPRGNIPLQVPFRAAYDEGPPFAQIFSVSPRSPRYFDVVACEYGESGIRRNHFCFATSDVPGALPGNPCIVQIVAEGRDSSPSRKSFIIRDDPMVTAGLYFDELASPQPG